MSFIAIPAVVAGVGLFMNRDGKQSRDANPVVTVNSTKISNQDLARTEADNVNTLLQDPVGPSNYAFQSNAWSNAFIGGRATQNVDPRRGNERLELYSGQTDETYMKKREVKPMFDPTSGQTFVNGAPVQYDIRRYDGGLRHEGVKPIQEEWVGPGLNLPTNQISGGGFHQYLRLKPTNVAANAKLTGELAAQWKSGAALVGKPQVQGVITKKGPERYYEQPMTSVLPTGAHVDRQMSRPNQILPCVNDKHTQWFGPAGSAHAANHETYATQQNLLPTQREDSYLPVCDNAGLVGGAGSVSMGSYVPENHRAGYYTTDREDTGGDAQARVTGMWGGYGSGTVPVQNDPNMTQRETFGDTSNTYVSNTGSINRFAHNDGAYDLISDPTQRSQTHSDYKGIAGSAVSGRLAYNSDSYDLTAGVTQREQTHTSYGGPGGSGFAAKPMSYDDIMGGAAAVGKINQIRPEEEGGRVPGQGGMNIRDDAHNLVQESSCKDRSYELSGQGRRPVMQGSNVGQYYSQLGEFNQNPNRIEHWDDRLDPSTLNALQNNPYNKSVHGKQVY